MPKEDYYKILGVDKNSSEAEIKQAYHKLVLKWHPDRNPQNKEQATAKIKEINEAKEVLLDKEKRQKYDQYGHAGENFQTGSGGFEGFEGNASDAFKDIFDIFFGRGGSQRTANTASRWQPRKGEDVLLSGLDLDFKESVLGTTCEVEIYLAKACPNCNKSRFDLEKYTSSCSRCGGKGVVVRRAFFGESIYTTCSNCNGQGRTINRKCSTCSDKRFIRQKETLSIKVPSGIQPGKRYYYPKLGHDGWYGGEKGDVYIEFRVKKHPYFNRKGNDIHVTLPISFLDAILGNQVEVITLEALQLEEKSEKIRVPVGTQNGDHHVLKGRGCYKDVGSSQRGDFYIHFQIIVPTPDEISKETKEELKKIEKKTQERDDWNPNRDFIKKNKNVI
jgi:molecular chaperone DnaJ